MWLDEADGFAEIFRGYFPYYLLVALPIFIIMSPVYPVAASHEFSVYRMHQYDLHTVPHGCRSASFNLEGRSLSSWSTSRHCVVARIQDVSIEQFMEIRGKAGALLLVLPSNDTALTEKEKQHIELLELAMVQQEISAPVYFAQWSPEVEDIVRDLQHSTGTHDKTSTALEALLNTVSSNGYQIVVSAASPQKLESKPVTLHGRLAGKAGAGQTVVVAASYDAFGVVPLGVQFVHKKINLADEVLAWPHERFSIRRMTAFTLSALQSHKDPSRSSILDLPSEAGLRNLVTNIRLTARALAAHVYNLTEDSSVDEDLSLYDEALGVSETSIRHWYQYLASQARAPQIVTTSATPSAGVTGAIERALSRYMEVTVTSHTVDKREPEYTLYGPTSATLFVYSVKPAVFDLVLTLVIMAYLSVLYFAIQWFPRFYEEYATFVTGKAKVD